MTTREEFKDLVAVYGEECSVGSASSIRAACDALRDAWDAQAAELQAARAEVDALKATPPQVPGAVPQPAPTTSRVSQDVLPRALVHARDVQRARLFRSFGGTEEFLEGLASALVECGVTDIAAALEARAVAGLKKYGRPLQTHNGRSALEDLAQELLDAWMYAVQAEMEAEDAEAILGGSAWSASQPR